MIIESIIFVILLPQMRLFFSFFNSFTIELLFFIESIFPDLHLFTHHMIIYDYFNIDNKNRYFKSLNMYVVCFLKKWRGIMTV